MDPLVASLILFAGLFLVAAVITALVATDGPAAPPRRVAKSRTRSRPLPVEIFCPPTNAAAGVGIGIRREGRSVGLTILRCEHFPDGPVACDMECLTAEAVA